MGENQCLTYLWLRLWRGRLKCAGTGCSAASGIAPAGKNRSRKMVRRAQSAWGDENQEFGVLQRIVPPPEPIARSWYFREARQAGNRARLFRIGEPAEQRRFVFFDAYGLRQCAVGDNGNPVHAAAGERANFKFELQGHFVVGMHGRRGLYFYAEVDVFGSR